MTETLGDKVETAMKGAGIKARPFAELVGCHYTTIYALLANRETLVPLRIVQENIYNVIDFLTKSVADGKLPLNSGLSAAQKTEELKRMYYSYTNPNNSVELN